MKKLPRVPNRNLTVLVLDNYPNANYSCANYPVFLPTLDCPYPGWCLEILNHLAEEANITVEWVVRHGEFDWGIPTDNGTFTGVLGEIEAGHFDTACLLYEKTVVRTEHFTYSMPISQIVPIFVVKELPPSVISVIFTFLRPFIISLWLLFLLVVIIQIAISMLIGSIEIRLRMRKKQHIGEFAWKVVDEFFSDGRNHFTLYAGSILRITFSVFAIGMLPEIYKGVLLTSLVKDPVISPINDAQDVIALVASGKYQLTTDKSSWFVQEAEDSNEEFFVELRKAIVKNPITYRDVVGDVDEIMREGHYIFQSQLETGDLIKCYQACSTIIVSKGLPDRSAHLMWREDNPFRVAIDDMILMNYEMTQNVHDRYFVRRDFMSMRPKNCPAASYDPKSADGLNLWAVIGMFAVGLVGLVIAGIVLLVERMVHRRKQRTLQATKLQRKSRLFP